MLNEIVTKQIIAAYKAARDSGEITWSIEDVMEFFDCYFIWYQEIFGRPHPHMTTKTVLSVIARIQYDDYCDEGYDLSSYKQMIPQFLSQTNMENCNYSISVFMTGNIRLLRFYETCAGGFPDNTWEEKP